MMKCSFINIWKCAFCFYVWSVHFTGREKVFDSHRTPMAIVDQTNLKHPKIEGEIDRWNGDKTCRRKKEGFNGHISATWMQKNVTKMQKEWNQHLWGINYIECYRPLIKMRTFNTKWKAYTNHAETDSKKKQSSKKQRKKSKNRPT